MRLYLRTTTGFPRSSALFAQCGFLLTAWFPGRYRRGFIRSGGPGTVGAVLIPLVGRNLVRGVSYSRDSEGLKSMQHWISGGFKMGDIMSLVTVVPRLPLRRWSRWWRAGVVREHPGAARCLVAGGYDVCVGAQALFAHGDGLGGGLVVRRGFREKRGFAAFMETVVDAGPIPPIPAGDGPGDGSWQLGGFCAGRVGYCLWRCFGARVSAFSPVKSTQGV